MENNKAKILRERLLNSSSEFIYSFLESRHEKAKRSNVTLRYEKDGNSDFIDTALLDLNEGLVNLGLAQYTESSDVINKLFVIGNEAIRLSCLQNRFVSGLNIYDYKVIRDLSYDEKNALFNNEEIPQEILEDLYLKEGIFTDISEEQWQDLILCSRLNTRLTKYFDSTWLDGHTQFSYNRLLDVLWSLLERVPVTPSWGFTLTNLLEKAVPPRGKKTKYIEDLLQKWRDPEAYGSKEDTYFYIRLSIAKLIDTYTEQFKLLKESEDLALRSSYYYRFTPSDSNELLPLFEKDGDDFLWCALLNDNLYKSSKLRNQFRDLIFEHSARENQDLFNYNLFNTRLSYLREKEPDEFSDDEGEVETGESVQSDIAVESLNGITSIQKQLSNLKSLLKYLTIILAVYLLLK